MPGEQLFIDSTASLQLVQKYKQLKKKIKVLIKFIFFKEINIIKNN